MRQWPRVPAGGSEREPASRRLDRASTLCPPERSFSCGCPQASARNPARVWTRDPRSGLLGARAAGTPRFGLWARGFPAGWPGCAGLRWARLLCPARLPQGARGRAAEGRPARGQMQQMRGDPSCWARSRSAAGGVRRAVCSAPASNFFSPAAGELGEGW